MKPFIFKAILILAVLLNFNTYSQSNLLKKAYKTNSTVLLDEFMYNWERSITPISYDEFNSLSDTIQEVYTIAEAFYDSVIPDSTPQKFDTSAIRHIIPIWDLGPREFKKTHLKYYSNVKYFIFPLSINYSINYAKDYVKPWIYNLLLKDSTVTYTTGKITNFRPRLYKQGIRLVYLTNDYFNILKTFVGKRYYNNLTGSDEDFLKKERFLNSTIKIVCGGLIEPDELNRDCLLNFPLIKSIYIKNSFLEAKVIYNDGCAEYEAYMKKIDGKWKWLKNTLLGIC